MSDEENDLLEEAMEQILFEEAKKHEEELGDGSSPGEDESI